MLNMKLEVGGLERKSVEQKSASIELLTSCARGMRGASAVLMTALLVVTLPAIAVQEEMSEMERMNGFSTGTSICSVCINEIMVNPSGSEQGEYPDGEWVEIVNVGGSPVSLEGWYLEDQGGWIHYINESTWVGFSLLQESWIINSGDHIVVAENNVGTLRLNNGGEVLFLKDSGGTTVHRVTTENSDSGVSKVNDGEHTGDDLFVDSEISTPGEDNAADPIDYSGGSDLLFTRIMPVGVSGHEADWIEIQNVGDSAIDMSGWSISRNRSFTPPWTSPWVSTFRDISISSGERIILTSEPSSLPDWLSDRIVDGEVAMDTMPRLIDSGTALQLISPNGTIIDTLVYDGGNAEISEWNGPSVSVRGEGSAGLVLMRGDGCTDLPDTDSAADWEVRTFRVGASLFCAEGPITAETTDGAWASIGPEGALGDLIGWIDGAETSLHIHIYEFLSPDVTHAILRAIQRGVDVTILLEEGILDSNSVGESQKGHANVLHDAGADVLWMVDPDGMSSPYTYIHSKIAIRDNSGAWISSGNMKDSSLPPAGDSGNREWSLFIESPAIAAKLAEWMSWDENTDQRYTKPHGSWALPPDGWILPSPTGTTSGDPSLTDSDASPGFRALPIVCPDNCLAEIIGAINESEETLYISAQYLDVDWYWGFSDTNPLLDSIKSAAERGVSVRLLLNAFYADEETWDLVELVNAEWNESGGLDATARLMSTSDSITKLHNKGMIVDGETVLVGSINWGSSAMLRNREHGIMIMDSDFASIYASSFENDWNRVDERTDTDGDTLPDLWESINGLNRHRASVAGTALSEQSLDPDEDGLDNRKEFLLGGDPMDEDTDGDCIKDGDEWEFAASVLRPESAAIISEDVDQDGIPDGEEFGCTVEVIIQDDEDNEDDAVDSTPVEDDDGDDGFVNLREDPLSAPGAKMLLGLTIIAAIFLALAGASMLRKPKTKAKTMLIDDEGYRFGDDPEGAILAGTRFDESVEDARERTTGRNDGKHGEIVLDGFGFENMGRDEVQWRLDAGATIEELRNEAEEGGP